MIENLKLPSTPEEIQAYIEQLRRQNEQNAALLAPFYQWAHQKVAEHEAQALQEGENNPFLWANVANRNKV